MSEYRYKTEDLAAELDVTPKTIRRKARALNLGIHVGGPAGYRYSDEDRRKLLDSLRPVVAVTKKQRRRGRAA